MRSRLTTSFLVGGIVGATTYAMLSQNATSTRKLKKAMLHAGKRFLSGSFWK